MNSLFFIDPYWKNINAFLRPIRIAQKLTAPLKQFDYRRLFGPAKSFPGKRAVKTPLLKSCQDVKLSSPARDLNSIIFHKLDPHEITTVHMMITSEEGKLLTRQEYLDVVYSLENIDLFIDMTSTMRAGRYKAGHKSQNGTYVKTGLTYNEAIALVELIKNEGTAMLPKKISSLDVLHPEKIIERARRRVDVKLSRYEWMCFHTMRYGNPDKKRYMFKPPPGYRYIVILPLNDHLNNS